MTKGHFAGTQITLIDTSPKPLIKPLILPRDDQGSSPQSPDRHRDRGTVGFAWLTNLRKFKNWKKVRLALAGVFHRQLPTVNRLFPSTVFPLLPVDLSQFFQLGHDMLKLILEILDGILISDTLQKVMVG